MPKRLVAALLLLTFLVAFGGVAANASVIGSAVKLFGIGFVVSKFGPQINSFINTLLNEHGVKWEGTTKVVPIISIGKGGHVGAAQVAGAPDIVAQTKAVGQGEVSIGGLRGKLLVPMSTTNPLKGVQKVKGVGVTAIIDFRF
jgi:hypothetical protein